MKSKYLILGVLILLIFISGCVKEETPAKAPAETPPTVQEEIPSVTKQSPPEKEDIEQMPESVLQELCAEESWPPECRVIPDAEGRNLCEKCQGLTGEKKVETIEPPDLTQLTFFEEEEGKAVDPDWGPDGSQIVFCLMKGQTQTLYLINSDGTELTKISLGFDPSWSPVGNKIAYTSNNQIYTMNSNGKEIIQLTTENSNANPAWSPDGTKITYTYHEDGKPSIWVMNSDGTGKTPLTTYVDGECNLPSFSYDGSKIIYVKGPIWNTFVEILPTKLNEIWIMNGDGSNKHMIYAPGDSYQWPFQRAWNKNNKILFLKSGILEDKLPKMFIINSDGTNPKQMVSPTRDSFGRPDYFYLDPVWDNAYTKVVAVRKIIDGPQNVVTFSWEE